jgi:iron(III) transport system ATP-binding protein
VTQLPAAKRNTALVFQSYALWPHMTVAQNVSFGLDVRRVASAEKRSRVQQVLELVRLADLAERKPMQLSGGQQQRVALARALVVNPDVLLLDEPLSNLDAKLRVQMRLEIRRICHEARITTVYVTHDQEEALSMADRLAVMRHGALCQIGTPIELYTRPGSRFVADFLGEANFIDAQITRRDGQTILLQSDIGSLRALGGAAAPPDGQVVCCVRPEAIRLLASGESADNELTGRTVDSVYMGSIAHHRVELSGGIVIKVQQLKPAAVARPDESVRLGFDSADVVVLTE